MGVLYATKHRITCLSFLMGARAIKALVKESLEKLHVIKQSLIPVNHDQKLS